MNLDETADEAFAYMRRIFGEDYVAENPSDALRFAGDWMVAAGHDAVGQAILSLQDVLFRPDSIGSAN